MKKLITTALCFALMGSTSAFADSGKKILLETENAPIVTAEKKEIPDTKPEKKEKRRKISLKSYRSENPLQIQFMIAGNNAIIDGTSSGIGIKASYAFSKSLNISFMTQVRRDGDTFDNDRKYTYDEEEVFGQDNVDDIESEMGLNHVLEISYSPWEFGLYFSAGAYYHGEEKHEVDYKKAKREINGTEYTTGLEAEVEYSARVVPTIGVGYNQVFSNGITLGTGFNVALASGQTPDVDVRAVNSNSAVVQSDLDHWKDQIEHNEKRYAGMAYFSVGYAF